MGNGNRFTGGGGGGGGGDVQSVDVGLGLNSESSSHKNTVYWSNSSPYNRQNRHYQFHQASEIFGGVMGASGKLLFTATQWQELERQKTIYMYIMASIPVPPQLLSLSSIQSNRVGTGLRFSNGSDLEPWRCRRTDGKKWRCAKDVAPDQKYCERHAHKTRNRSRKLVETQSKNMKENPSVLSAANQRTKCSDWLMKSGTNGDQFQLQMPQSSGVTKKDQILKQDFKIHQQDPYFDHNNYSLNTSGNTNDAIDAWSRIGGGDECSLTLSMQSSGGSEIEFDHESFQMAVGMLRGDREGCGDVFKPQQPWLNQASWAGSGVTPGGPLGEALCLGMTSTQNEPYSHGYSYSTTTSSSCEGGGGGGHELDFNFVNPHDD